MRFIYLVATVKFTYVSVFFYSPSDDISTLGHLLASSSCLMTICVLHKNTDKSSYLTAVLDKFDLPHPAAVRPAVAVTTNGVTYADHANFFFRLFTFAPATVVRCDTRRSSAPQSLFFTSSSIYRVFHVAQCTSSFPPNPASRNSPC